MKDLKTSPCTGKAKGGKCTTPVLWGRTEGTFSEDGSRILEKKIPLDSRAPVYEIIGQDERGYIIRRLENAYVTHFASCADRELFAAARRSDQKRGT